LLLNAKAFLCQNTSPDIPRVVCCYRGYCRPSGRPRVSESATCCSSTARIQLPAVSRWHGHLYDLATAISEVSGLDLNVQFDDPLLGRRGMGCSNGAGLDFASFFGGRVGVRPVSSRRHSGESRRLMHPMPQWLWVSRYAFFLPQSLVRTAFWRAEKIWLRLYPRELIIGVAGVTSLAGTAVPLYSDSSAKAQTARVIAGIRALEKKIGSSEIRLNGKENYGSGQGKFLHKGAYSPLTARLAQSAQRRENSGSLFHSSPWPGNDRAENQWSKTLILANSGRTRKYRCLR